MSNTPAFQSVADDFAFIDDWDERYRYLIDLGRQLPSYPEALRDEAHRVKGCASQVWLSMEDQAGTFRIAGDSDAAIVKGLVALVIKLFDGVPVSEAKTVDARTALEALDLKDHITPQRSNGLASMLAVIDARLGQLASDGTA